MSDVVFTKMHGTGNDFIVIDALENVPKDPADLARKLCARRFSVGADGMILVLLSDKADYRMRIFNPDGSEPEMCGNGIRCFAKFLKEKGITDKEKLEVETGAGIIKPEFVGDKVKVDMGEPILSQKDIPMKGELERVVSEKLKVDGEELEVTAVSMGNPHAIFYVTSVEDAPVQTTGQKVEVHEHFPNKTNVEFIELLSEDKIKMRVWERGAGETLACGTGACASVVASVLNAKTERKVTVELLGGELEVEWKEEDNHVYMTGPAKVVFEGKIDDGS